jgi:hypothetical protein
VTTEQKKKKKKKKSQKRVLRKFKWGKKKNGLKMTQMTKYEKGPTAKSGKSFEFPTHLSAFFGRNFRRFCD